MLVHCNGMSAKVKRKILYIQYTCNVPCEIETNRLKSIETLRNAMSKYLFDCKIKLLCV